MEREPNLLSHEVVKLMADSLCAGVSEGDVIRGLGEALQSLDSDLATARTVHFRKLYKLGWKELLDRFVDPKDQDVVTRRFRGLVF